MGQHDHSYKLLFSHPQMVRDLLEGLVREEWLAQLDYASLEKVSASYISGDLRARADDMVWRVRWGENWVYIYLLLEFQSTVDPYMAVRMLTYVGLLYEDLIKAGQLPADGRLPPVFPIVLYNGRTRWHAAQELASLIQPGPRALELYCPQMRYLLIEEQAYLDSELAPLRNLVAAMFRLENSRTGANFREIVSSLIEWLKSPEQTGLRRAFGVWLGRVIIPRRQDEPVGMTEDFEEMRKMLADSFERWKEHTKQEGLAEGRMEGRMQGRMEGRVEGRMQGLTEGRREGEARLLLRLLQKRFGELPQWACSRVQAAPMEQIELWFEQALDAQSVEALLGDRVMDTSCPS